MTGNVDHIINASADPVVALVVAACAISGELPMSAQPLSPYYHNAHVVALVHIQVRVHVSLVCSPNSASHARPWLLKGKNTLDIVAVNLLARDGVDDCRFNTEEGERCGTRLRRRDTAKWCNDMRTSLGLPVCL